MDLKLIKAEIEALKIPKSDIEKCINDEMRIVSIARNNAINDALAIIQAHINPKPDPTSSGIWKCAKDGNNHYVTVAEDLSYPKYCAGGQWEKVKDI